MRIGIIGGGLMGMALAYYLSETPHEITLLEQSSSLGGLNGAVDLGDGALISLYHHALLPDDTHIQDLCERLHIASDLRFMPAPTGFIHHGDVHSLNSIWDFLAFAPLPLPDRLRLAASIRQISRLQDWQSLDSIPVRDWLIELSGERVFNRIWAPLLEAKFDNQYDHIPATYIWSWVKRMMSTRKGPRLQSTIGYLRQGHVTLIEAMAEALINRGGTIYTETRVREIEIRQGQLYQVRTPTGVMDFDLLIAALPTPTFSRLIPGADQGYLDQLDESRYLGLVCPMLVLDRPLSPYWTLNLTDPSSPFSSVIEIPHPTHSGYRVVYLPKYTAPENDWMGVPDSDIREAWLIRLRQLFPDLKPDQIKQFTVSRSRYVEPVHTVDPLRQIIPVQTPYDGLLLANSSQVYPGLPTSEAVLIHAQQVAAMALTATRKLRATTAA